MYPQRFVGPAAQARLHNDSDLWALRHDLRDQPEHIMFESCCDNRRRFKHHCMSCRELIKRRRHMCHHVMQDVSTNDVC